MENRPRVPKLIVILLSVLLLTGAVVAAVSLDGGRWLTANPVFAQPEAQEQNVAPVTGPSSDFDSLEEQSAPSRVGCNHESAESPEDW